MAFNSLEEFRSARDEALSKTDFLMLPDAPKPEDLSDLLVAYRQELRDLPARADAEGLEGLELPVAPVIPNLNKVGDGEPETSSEAE